MPPFNALLNKDLNYHFIALGGVGQSALAKILIQRGYSVSGSDICDSKYLKELKELGAKVFIGHNEDNLPSNSIVVISSAIKEDNPELKKARALKLDILHRSDMLNILSRDFPLFIGFAGTHGKTTTSGFASYLLSKAGSEPGFAVGGIIPEINTNANASKKSNLFIAELDESDGTIVKYAPNILVINNLEADHLDFYKNGLPDVLNTFKKLVSGLPKDAKVIVNIDDTGVNKFLETIQGFDIIKFSAKNILEQGYCAKDIKYNSSGAVFEILRNNKTLGEISISLKGIHNIYNTLAVIAALLEVGVEFENIQKYFASFSGMGRRFQTVYKTKDIEIVDDYAHHPSEIKTTLKAAADYKIKSGRNKLVAIFQPHRYTRLRGLWDDFLVAFDDCDTLIVLDVFSAGDSFDAEFNSEKFVDTLKGKSPQKEIYYIPGKIEEISAAVAKYADKNSLVLTLGAGDITKLGKLIGEAL